MQDRPTAQELVEAVATFLETEILPTLVDSRLRFRGLIASNVLQIVARELAHENAGRPKEWSLLAAVLGKSSTEAPESDAVLVAGIEAMSHELRDRIRSGDFDDPTQFAKALDVAEGSVVDKLRVSNPRFLARLGIQ